MMCEAGVAGNGGAAVAREIGCSHGARFNYKVMLRNEPHIRDWIEPRVVSLASRQTDATVFSCRVTRAALISA